MAQLVERTLGKGEVGGSTPPISTIFIIKPLRCGFFVPEIYAILKTIVVLWVYF